MYSKLISTIKDNLEAVNEIKKVYAHPVSKITKYPACIFYPDNFENSFETVKENKKYYRFKLFIIIGITQTTTENIFETVLPNVVDKVLEKFDELWDMGTIGGHRISGIVDSGEWGMSEENKSLEAWAEMDIRVQVLTTN